MKTDRLLTIVTLLLNRRRVAAKELAERFEVSVRTVYRDVEALSLAGIPIYAERGPNGGIFLSEDYTLDRTLFSPEEQRSLLTALQTMRAANHPGSEKLLEKLRALFKPEPADWMKVNFSGWEGPREHIFYCLRDGILQSRAVELDYYNAQGISSHRVIEPLQLISQGSGWYLSAWCRNRGDYRYFRLSRMENVRMLDEHFTPRPPPEEKISTGKEKLVHLHMIFDASMQYRVLDEFPLRAMKRLPDGRTEVRWTYPESGWVTSFLLSFGGAVELLSPDGLRDALGEHAKKMLGYYNNT